MDTSFDRMNHDVLLQILQYLNASSSCTTPKQNNKPLHALSLTNKRLRDQCSPFLFKRILLRADRYLALERLEEMDACPTLTTFVRYASMPILASNPPS